MDNLSIYCADVGSVGQGNFAWAAAAGGQAPTEESCQHIAALAEAVSSDLAAGKPVALGFECPLFVPVPESPGELGKARLNEQSSWSAGPGATSLVTGLPQAAWVLRAIAEHTKPEVFLDWKFFANHGSGLLVWEAFVTGAGKELAAEGANRHHAEALLACATLEERLPWPEADVKCDEPYSLAGAALLWSGLSEDLNLLRTAPLVIKPGAL